MKLFALCIAGMLLLSGCSNEQYSLERAYWHISRDAQRILRGQDGIPAAEREKINRALTAFIRKHPSAPQAVSAQFLLAKLLIEQKRFADARALAEAIRAGYPTHPDSEKIGSEALFIMGQSYEKAGEWQQAQTIYARISAEYPETLRAYLLPAYIARHYVRAGDEEKGREAYRMAGNYYLQQADKFAGTSTGFNSLLIAAQSFRSMRDWIRAAETLQRAATEYPRKARARELMLQAAGIYEFELKNRKEADSIRARANNLNAFNTANTGERQ